MSPSKQPPITPVFQTVYGNAQSFRTLKVLIAAKYGNKQVDVKDQTPSADKFPLGVVGPPKS